MEINALAQNNEEVQQPAVGSEPIKKGHNKRRITIFVVVSLFNVALLALLWSLLLVPKAGLSQANSSSGLGDMSSPLLGKVAPAFSLPDLNASSKAVSLSKFKGRPVMLNFWSSSCPPCQEEATFLQSSWTNKLQSKGVVFVGIDGAEKSNDDALAFLHKYGITYTNVKDTLTGSTGIDYGTTGNPETFFIDKHGNVVARWLGPLTDQGLDAELTKMQVN